MKLTDLEAKFVRHEEFDYTGDFCTMPIDTDEQYRAWVEAGRPTERRTEKRERSVEVAELAHAQGVRFLCPACFQKNGGAVGTHAVVVTFRDRGVPDNLGSHNREGQPSRWAVAGTSLQDLQLTPSVDCGCWHGFVGSSGVPPGEAR